MAYPSAALRTLALRVDQAHPTQIFTEAGSPVNTALSRQAAHLDEESLEYIEVESALRCSPMFALAAEEYAQELRRAAGADGHPGVHRRAALLRFATRMVLAGRMGAR